jgi:hypothetical protein
MRSSHQNSATTDQADRVRRSISPDLNHAIDLKQTSIRQFSRMDRSAITQRIDELDHEWDVERVLEVNASTLALSGLLLRLTTNRKWFLLPGVVLPLLLRHGLQG